MLTRSRLYNRVLNRIYEKQIGTIVSVETTEAVASLTFDDGPDPEYTPRLLDLLARFEAKATFFMVGQSAERYPDLVRQVSGEGHTIGNHSWNHPSFPGLSGGERRRQLRACARALAPYEVKLFRPPFGDQTPRVRMDARMLGYQVFMGNLDVCDWTSKDSGSMAKELAARVAPGSIILLHDAIFPTNARRVNQAPLIDRNPMLAALERFLKHQSDKYRFVTLPELLATGRAVTKNWIATPDS